MDLNDKIQYNKKIPIKEFMLKKIIQEHNFKFDFEFGGSIIDPFNDKEYYQRYKYDCRISKDNQSFEYPFFDSISNYNQNYIIKEDINDLFYMILSIFEDSIFLYNEDIKDFCSYLNLYFESNNKNNCKTLYKQYKELKRINKEFLKIFSLNEIENIIEDLREFEDQYI